MFNVWRQKRKIFKLIKSAGYTCDIYYDSRCDFCREYPYLLREVKHYISPAGEHFQRGNKIVALFCARCWHISKRYSGHHCYDTTDENSNLVEYILKNHRTDKVLGIIRSALELAQGNFEKIYSRLPREQILPDNSPYRGCLGPTEVHQNG